MSASEHTTPGDPAVEQLHAILLAYGKHGKDERCRDRVGVDVVGVIIDFIARTDKTLYSIFMENPKLYEDLFVADGTSRGTHLVRYVVDVYGPADVRLRDCQLTFPLVQRAASVLAEEQKVRTMAEKCSQAGRLEDLRRLAESGFSPIWQLSDIHFGDLNHVQPNPRELAASFGQLVAMYDFCRPEFVVVSGDLTSRSDPHEFKAFREFVECLSTKIWSRLRPGRFLVIPGNHDSTWLSGGTGDKLSRFRKHVADGAFCVTPLGVEREALDDVEIVRVLPESDAVPPLALVVCEALGLEFVLLLSAYYAGNVPHEMRDLLRNAGRGKDRRLIDLLREDKGLVTQEYIEAIVKALPPQGRLRIAVTHHHLDTCGRDFCPNENAPLTLRRLAQAGVRLVWHGHVHFFETPSLVPPVRNEFAYAVPCTTLTGEPAPSGYHGFAVHMVGPSPAGETKRRVSTFHWGLSKFASFEAQDVGLRYEFNVSPDALDLLR